MTARRLSALLILALACTTAALFWFPGQEAAHLHKKAQQDPGPAPPPLAPAGLDNRHLTREEIKPAAAENTP